MMDRFKVGDVVQWETGHNHRGVVRQVLNANRILVERYSPALDYWIQDEWKASLWDPCPEPAATEFRQQYALRRLEE